ncbi:MAG: hypothetical protein ACLVJ1_00360 [Oscillospiraceae bacterium]
MNIRNTAAPALILALLVSLGSAFAATPDAAADNPQCAKYGHTKGTRIGERRTPEPNASDAAYCYCDVVYPEYQCGRCGEAWVTGAGIVERQTHDKLCYHFKKGMCKGWYCKNCHTYSWK